MFSSMTEADFHKLAGDYETQSEDGIRKLLQFFHSNDFISYNFLVLFVCFFFLFKKRVTTRLEDKVVQLEK